MALTPPSTRTWAGTLAVGQVLPVRPNFGRTVLLVWSRDSRSTLMQQMAVVIAAGRAELRVDVVRGVHVLGADMVRLRFGGTFLDCHARLQAHRDVVIVAVALDRWDSTSGLGNGYLDESGRRIEVVDVPVVT